jgi:hypothetical protein
MGGARSTDGNEKYNILVRKPERKNRSEELDVDGKIIL